MFIDDDVYMCPGWDKRLIDAAGFEDPIISGHAHPYNHTVLTEYGEAYETTVLSTVHLFMRWEAWDEIGYFIEPGGPGGSEDVDYCKRATEKAWRLYVTKPHCVIHCGLSSSQGKSIVGCDQVIQRNNEIIRHYGLQRKVVML